MPNLSYIQYFVQKKILGKKNTLLIAPSLSNSKGSKSSVECRLLGAL